MRKTRLTDNALYNAVNEMADGLIDADLGGQLFKKRVALPGQGKRGATRTIVATRFDDRWVFLYGFGKNERSNISKEELKAFQEVATDLLGLDEKQLKIAINSGVIAEVHNGNDQT